MSAIREFAGIRNTEDAVSCALIFLVVLPLAAWMSLDPTGFAKFAIGVFA